MAFTSGVLLHNKTSNDDGRVIGVRTENGTTIYTVSVSKDSTTWSMGARESYWPEDEVELSTNKFLMRNE
jgi:hypothetical protein